MFKILKEYAGENKEYKKTTNPKIFYDWLAETFDVFVDDKTIAVIYGGNRGFWAEKIAELAENLSKEQETENG